MDTEVFVAFIQACISSVDTVLCLITMIGNGQADCKSKVVVEPNDNCKHSYLSSAMIPSWDGSQELSKSSTWFNSWEPMSISSFSSS